MKSIKVQLLLAAMGVTAVVLAGCSNSNDASQTPVVQGQPGLASGAVAATSTADKKALPEVVMYKSPNCECCTGWADHLRKEGFTVVVHKRDDMDVIKDKYGVTSKLASCHTAIVDGYVIEGHVPASDVERLLTERPDVVGLTAPGMPMKSPGMQQAGQIPKNYDVLAFDADGTSHVFSHY